MYPRTLVLTNRPQVSRGSSDPNFVPGRGFGTGGYKGQFMNSITRDAELFLLGVYPLFLHPPLVGSWRVTLSFAAVQFY